MSSNLETVALIAIVAGLVCAAGAFFANSYVQSIYFPGIGTDTRYPYKVYVFPLFFFAVLLLVVGFATAIADKARPKRIVLKPVSSIPVELFEPCPVCGSRIPPGSRFCNRCGQAINQNKNNQGPDKNT